MPIFDAGRRLFFGALCSGALASACQSEGRQVTSSSAQPSAAAVPAAEAAALRRLSAAEYRRASAAITKSDLSYRSPGVRRAAARSLARIADDEARKHLLELLRNEDAEVVVWAAYGLGHVCQGHERDLVRHLVLRATSWGVTSSAKPESTEHLAPLLSIARALGRCGTAEAEHTLRAWLDEPRLAEEAALALGDLAGETRRLEDTSIVALLDQAAEVKQALDHGLYPLARLPSLSPTVAARLLEVAPSHLSAKGTKRTFAIRALGSAGDAAAPLLKQVLSNDEYSAIDRTLASRALRRVGAEGQSALAEVLPSLLPLASDEKQLQTAGFGVLLTTLEGLQAALPKARSTLEQLAELPIGQAAPSVLQRRVRLRCAAAALLAGRASAAQRLLACDPAPDGRWGQLARIRALDQGPLSGARGRVWQRFADAKDPVVRQAALRLLAQHPEVPAAHTILARALAAEEPGTVATAAQLLAAYPDRAAEDRDQARAAAPHATLIKALEAALEQQAKGTSIEVTTAVMDAVGALQLLSAKPSLEKLCTSDNPTLRQHAEQALRMLGDKARTCTTFQPSQKPPGEWSKALGLTRPLQLSLETDVGQLEITLDPRWAPMAVARLLDLVRAGYYNDMAVHRVVPGFVVQFGDKVGDGFGSSGAAPLRCETAPVPFDVGNVGMALAGRDTAQSQLFVTLERYPRLDGNYSWVGTAGPGWERLSQGDRIASMRIRE